MDAIELATVFILSMVVGYELITKIPPTLHTPLMSGTNAISGITIVGALLLIHSSSAPYAQALGVAALVFAAINVVGGFVVTDRMLKMFSVKGRKK